MNNHRAAFTTYIVGFLISIILTVVAYVFAMDHITSLHHTFSHEFLIGLFLVLAFIQLAVQLLFFLHIGQKSNRWNLLFFFITFGGVTIVVVGSLWIMYHLNYNMTPKDMDQQILLEEGIHTH